MEKFRSHTSTFPLVEMHSRVSDALKQTRLHAVDAVVSTNGREFWLHNKIDLVRAARKSPSKTLGELQIQELPVLSTTEVKKLGMNLTILKGSQIRKYFPTPQVKAVVTTVINNSSGDRMVVALTNPNGAFRVVGKVWVCPKGGERYRSPGICRAHGKVLRPE
jgi:hypothetical protein